MSRVLIRKGAETIVTLFLATLLLFVLMRLAPGDPIRMLLQHSSDVAVGDARALEEKASELRADFGLDRPIAVQYAEWIGRLLRFDLGSSIHTGRPVADEIAGRLPATLMLAACAMIIQIGLGLLFGMLSALKPKSIFDHIVRAACIALASTPAFAIGLLLLSLFAVKLQAYEISSDGGFGRVWLPAATLGVLGAPPFIRVVRAGMLAEFSQGYVLSALSRGLPKRVIVKQALRNAMLPFITVIGLSFATLVSGAVIVEAIFSWPGIGKYALDSILRKDYPVMQGYALLMVLLVVTIHLSMEVLYALVDPQIRRKGRGGVSHA